MAQKPLITISGASVKIMRSYDYCHFEVALSAVREDGITSSSIDDLRKEAIRLADRAVEQYKIAKSIEEWKTDNGYREISLAARAREASQTPESERTPEQKAVIKTYEDYLFRMQFEYDYEDDWDEEGWEDAGKR